MTGGGVQWELAEALKGVATARLFDDFAAEAKAWIRFSEGLRNASGSAAAAQMIPILRAVDQIRDDRRTDAAHFEHIIGMLSTIAEQEQATQAEQDVVIALMEMRVATLERVVALLVESAAGER